MMLEILRAVAGVAVFLLPGLALLLWLDIEGMLLKAAFVMGFSIVINTLIGLILGLTGRFTAAWFFGSVAMIAAILAVSSRVQNGSSRSHR